MRTGREMGRIRVIAWSSQRDRVRNQRASVCLCSGVGSIAGTVAILDGKFFLIVAVGENARGFRVGLALRQHGQFDVGSERQP